MYNHGWIINYAAMLYDMDRALGDLLDSIDRLGLLAMRRYPDFDNGSGLWERTPKGGKGSLYEENPDARVCPRRESIWFWFQSSVVQWDFLQTFYDLAGGTGTSPRTGWR